MAVMLSKTYAAFKAANVPDEMARAAAEATYIYRSVRQTLMPNSSER